jgi:hypothetical protein
MIKTNFKKKYKYNDPALVEFFVKNGYVIIKDLFDKKRIIGNDQLFPLRTYNAYVGTDKRLSRLYNKKKSSETEKLKKLTK